jgi:hypothetical protein
MNNKRFLFANFIDAINSKIQAVMVEKAKGKPIMTLFRALFSIGMALGAVCGSFFAGSTLRIALLLVVLHLLR